MDHLKELRKSGEEQRSQGDKKTVNSLVRLGVVCGLSLTGFTPVEGNIADLIFRVICSWGAGNNRCPEMSLSLGMESTSSKGHLPGPGHTFLDSPQNGLEKRML